MSKRMMALAAVLLAGGIGTASAQGQGQTRGPGAGQGQGSGKAVPPYTQQVPDTAPLGPHVTNPKANPSAAGTVREGDKSASQQKTGEDNREHSGSVGINANTHPLKSLEAGGEPRQEGVNAPPGVHPTPHSTMNRGAGR